MLTALTTDVTNVMSLDISVLIALLLLLKEIINSIDVDVAKMK